MNELYRLTHNGADMISSQAVAQHLWRHFQPSGLRDRISHLLNTNAHNTQLNLSTLMIIPCRHPFLCWTMKFWGNQEGRKSRREKQRNVILDFGKKAEGILNKLCYSTEFKLFRKQRRRKQKWPIENAWNNRKQLRRLRINKKRLSITTS
jgi:hypothetical protein